MQRKEVEIIPNKVEEEEHNSSHFGKIEFWENYYLTYHFININSFKTPQKYQ